METNWIQPQIKELKTEKVKGKKIDVVEVLFGRLKIEYYIDPKTYLPFYVRRSEWFDSTKNYGGEKEFYVEDYVEIEGVKLPQVIKRGKKTETKTIYQVNGKDNEKLFDVLPSIEAGADAWKPKQ